MASKSAKGKKSKFNLTVILALVGALLVLLSLCFIGLPAVITSVTLGDKTDTATLATVAEFMFGSKVKEGPVTVTSPIEPLAMTAFVFILLAVIAGCATFFCKYAAFGGALFAILAGILLFCLTKPTNQDYKDALELLGKLATVKLGSGAITSGLFCILGGASMTVAPLLAMFKKR